MKAVDVRLSPEQLKKLNDISAVPLPFPQSFVENPRVNQIVYGGTRDRIDTHRPSVAPWIRGRFVGRFAGRYAAFAEGMRLSPEAAMALETG